MSNEAISIVDRHEICRLAAMDLKSQIIKNGVFHVELQGRFEMVFDIAHKAGFCDATEQTVKRIGKIKAQFDEICGHFTT